MHNPLRDIDEVLTYFEHTYIRGRRIRGRGETKQKTPFLQGIAGANHPAEKRYRILLERVQRAVQTYGQTDILTYLRAICHLVNNKTVIALTILIA